MSTSRLDLMRWNVASIAIGGVIWVVAMLLRLFSTFAMDDLDALLLLAVLVIVPLAIPLLAIPGGRSGSSTIYRLAIVLQPIAALFGSIALFAPVGSVAAAITAALWLLFTALLGAQGLTTVAQMLLERHVTLADTCLAAALIYLPIGGAWFALARLGIRPLDVSPTIVRLTAIHFHFITLAALLITGYTGLALRPIQQRSVRNIYRVAAFGMLVCPLLVAAGITLTQATGQRVAESVAAVLLAFSLMAVAALSLRFVVPTPAILLARALLAISAVAVLLTMMLAAAYALGGVTGLWAITIAQMIAIHGWLNALAFGLCGLLGWRLRMAKTFSSGGCVCASSFPAERG